MLLARELARSLGGLAWIWGITSFAGAKSIGLYGSDGAEAAVPAGDRARRAALRDRLHRARRRHRRARRDAHGRGAGRRRLGHQRPARPGAPSAHVADYILLLARTDDGRREAAPGPDAVPRADRGGRRPITGAPEARDARDRLVRRRPRRRLRARRARARRAGQGVAHAAADAEQRAHHAARRSAAASSTACSRTRSRTCRSARRSASKIGEFQILQHYIADIAMWRHQAELVVHQAAWLQSRGSSASRRRRWPR